VYPGVPPPAPAFTCPFANPHEELENVGVAVNSVGSEIVNVFDSLQPLASATVNMWSPAVIPVKELPLDPEVDQA